MSNLSTSKALCSLSLAVVDDLDLEVLDPLLPCTLFPSVRVCFGR